MLAEAYSRDSKWNARARIPQQRLARNLQHACHAARNLQHACHANGRYCALRGVDACGRGGAKRDAGRMGALSRQQAHAICVLSVPLRS